MLRGEILTFHNSLHSHDKTNSLHHIITKGSGWTQTNCKRIDANSDIHGNPRYLQCEHDMHPLGHRNILLLSIHDRNNRILLAVIIVPSSWSDSM